MPELRSAVLVGRTNVGKSSLFNRLIGKTQAIVSSEPGTTRDVLRGLIDWQGDQFWLEDTGGIDPARGDPAGSAARRQLDRTLKRARVILFVVDGSVGLTPQDRTFARQLRTVTGRTIMVVNKVDGPKTESTANSVNLGFHDTILTSAKTGRGLGDLLDLVASYLESSTPPQPKLKIGLFGKTNVGKSSLFNRLMGEERSIVLATPHTTRDRVHGHFEREGNTIELVDTAGLRRQLQGAPNIEQQSAASSQHALDEVDISLLIIDGSVEPTWQDQRIGDLIVAAHTAALVIINKGDLVPQEDRRAFETKLMRWLPMVSWAPMVWVSARTGSGLPRLMPQLEAAAAAWQRRLKDDELAQFWRTLKRARTLRELPLVSFSQERTAPPRFTLRIRRKADMPKAIGPWVEGQLRKRFGFFGTPIAVRAEGVRAT